MAKIDVSLLVFDNKGKRYWGTAWQTQKWRFINHLELLMVKYICVYPKIFIYVYIIILKYEDLWKVIWIFYTSIKICSIDKII